MRELLPCPQCGEDSAEFDQGVCVDCCAENQRALDLHNAEHDRWRTLSDSQRADEIARAATIRSHP